MTATKRAWSLIPLLLAVIAFMALPNSGEAKFQSLFKLDGGPDGFYPQGPLLLKSGALYVPVTEGGQGDCENFFGVGCGVILRLTPPASGSGPWSRSRIFSFTGGPGGANPFAIQSLDSTNALYGVTIYGGSTNSFCGEEGCGTVFKLRPPATAGGSWTRTVIYRFQGEDDGWWPQSSLVRAPDGVVYGTTKFGGGQTGSNCESDSGCGTVYQLEPPSTGSIWTKTVLARFNGGTGGSEPFGAGLLRNSSGVLFGLTAYGGQQDGCSELLGYWGCGLIFSLTPPSTAGQPWTKKILHKFTQGTNGSPGGATPFDVGFLARDPSGALYGTTLYGGPDDAGVVFKLSPPSGSATQWKKQILYSFKGGANGANPFAGLVRVASGALYGTTIAGGASANCSGGCGTIFMLTPPSGSSTKWTKTTLHSFNGTNGSHPIGPLVPAQNGAFYGLTRDGGNNACDSGCGTVFKWSP